ncbi:MAG: nucleotidyl transferase AbiEii/AbiGii toxin family protein, partial [Cyclobacteriaceae bacterium]|nr:nucleotidyl transferase AbiEii/AbiGii toxin family protein [Cyclobacteriaceae bacterium HetDA_MAG_MS6]
MNQENYHFEILPSSQKELWLKLSQIPKDFVLYGGTAIAIRLGHRESIDFDFFSNKAFNTNMLYQEIDFLKNGKVIQSEKNTLSAIVKEGQGNVKVSFFGNLGLKQIEQPDDMNNGIKMASLIDLLGMKCATVPQR